jgi:hypothetical protein
MSRPGARAAALLGVLALGIAAIWLLRGDSREGAAEGSVLRRAPGAAAAQAPGFAALPADAPAVSLDELPAAPQPPAADMAPAGAATNAARLDALDLTLAHHDGEPAVGATVLLCRGTAIVESQVTDAAGRARFAPLDGAADLVIGGASDVPLTSTLAHASGAQRVTLPAGLAVSGQVLVDGARPVRPFLLAIVALPEARSAPITFAQHWQLRASVPGFAQDALANAQLVGADGRFRFSALPAGWQGRFDIGWQFVPAGGDAALAVRPPTGNVLLDVTSTLTASGRVIMASSGEPVPGALIDFEFKSDDATRSSTFPADGDGRFAIPGASYDERIDGLRLSIRHPGGLGFRDIAFTSQELARSHDLGDIALLDTRALTFVVRDVEGAPVAGAIAVSDDASATRSAPTDADGRGELSGMLCETASMTVWAHRFASQRVPLPQAAAAPSHVADPPLLVVLERCPALDVIVSAPDGTYPPGMSVVLSAEQKLFASADGEHDSSFVPSRWVFETGMSATRGSSSEATGFPDGRRILKGFVEMVVDRDGRVQAYDLLPEVPFDVSVRGPSGDCAWGPQRFSLAPHEFREVRVELLHGARDLLVRVVDPHGRALARAKVDIIASRNSSGMSATTDAEGLAKFWALYADAVPIRVSAAGFVRRTVDEVGVVSGGVPFVVQLASGREVEVTVRDASGRAVPAHSVRAWLDGAPVGEASTSGDLSCWKLTELPDSVLTLRAGVGGRMAEQSHDARMPTAEFMVPAMGALRVQMGFQPEPSLTYRLDVLGSGEAIGATTFDWPDDEDWLRGELLLGTLVPGDYAVTLYRMGAEAVACSREATVRVNAGETAEVVLMSR